MNIDDFDFDDRELEILELANLAGMSVPGFTTFTSNLTPTPDDEPDRFSYHGETPLKIVDHISAREWIKNRITVQAISSNISSLAYDKKAQDLYIGFHKGPTYLYYGIPEHLAITFFNAPSLGIYHRQHLYYWPNKKKL